MNLHAYVVVFNNFPCRKCNVISVVEIFHAQSYSFYLLRCIKISVFNIMSLFCDTFVIYYLGLIAKCKRYAVFCDRLQWKTVLFVLNCILLLHKWQYWGQMQPIELQRSRCLLCSPAYNFLVFLTFFAWFSCRRINAILVKKWRCRGSINLYAVIINLNIR